MTLCKPIFFLPKTSYNVNTGRVVPKQTLFVGQEFHHTNSKLFFEKGEHAEIMTPERVHIGFAQCTAHLWEDSSYIQTRHGKTFNTAENTFVFVITELE